MKKNIQLTFNAAYLTKQSTYLHLTVITIFNTIYFMFLFIYVCTYYFVTDVGGCRAV